MSPLKAPCDIPLETVCLSCLFKAFCYQGLFLHDFIERCWAHGSGDVAILTFWLRKWRLSALSRLLPFHGELGSKLNQIPALPAPRAVGLSVILSQIIKTKSCRQPLTEQETTGVYSVCFSFLNYGWGSVIDPSDSPGYSLHLKSELSLLLSGLG